MSSQVALDASALGARQAYPQAAARKPQADFGSAFERAARAVRGPAADNRPAKQPDAPTETERAAADQPADDLAQAKAPESSQPSAPETTNAQAQASSPATGNAAQAQAAADAEAAALAAEAAQAAEALTADATLALMIATGGTAAPAPTPIASDAQVAQAAAAVEGATTTPLAAAIAQAQAEAAAPATTPAPGVAAAATPAAATPGSLGEAARALGLTGIQTTTAAAAPAASTTPTNLGLALAADAETEGATLPMVGPTGAGAIGLALKDEALGPETSPLPVLVEDGDATIEASDAETSSIPQLNGDRTLTEATRTNQAAALARPDGAPRPDDVMPQLLKQADQMKAQQLNSIKLQLYPEHLGKLEIKVSSHQGVLTAQISADSQSVKAMLETQVVNLQRSLQDLGLKIDKVEVTLAGSGLGGFDMAGQDFGQPGQQQPGTGQAPRFNQGLGYEAWLPDELPEGAAWASADSNTAVDYVA